MEHRQGGIPANHLTQISQGLDGADFIIHCHEAHQHRVRPYGLPQPVRVYQAFFVHRQHRDFKAFLPQLVKGAAYRGVLNGGSNHMPALAFSGPGRPQDGPVIAFRAPGSKIDFLIFDPQQLRHGSGGFFYDILRLNPFAVQGRGIAPLVRQACQHSLPDRGGGPGSGGVVQINVHCIILFVSF